MSPAVPNADVTPFLDLMEADGLGPLARASFARAYAELASARAATVAEDSIEPVADLADAGDLAEPGPGTAALAAATVVIKVNGGLGTSMGLQGAKSLLEVRDDKTFLDLIVTQITGLARAGGAGPRLLLMNSFSTSADTRAYLAAHHPDLGDPADLEFLQTRVPKVLAHDLSPAAAVTDDAGLAWCPPGHGDIYVALAESGTLDALADAGIRYAFVSNADNLGATVDLALLHWFATSGAPFAMEVTRRTGADRKGGHLAVRRADGRLVLRESAQTDPADAAAFADIDRHRYFNTNNLWLDLSALAGGLRSAGGVLPLPVMRNHKNLDPRRADTPEVVQLETAMGAAIECFDDATAIAVPRSRFSPVKTCDDLIVLRSDACEIRGDGSVGLVDARDGIPPKVELDPDHYKLIDGMEALVADGVPSLVGCDTLVVTGPWAFAAGVTFVGDVVVDNPTAEPCRLEPGTYRGVVTAAGATASP